MKNFILRAVTGILFVAILIGGIIYSPLSFIILFTVISALTVYEFAQLINKTGTAKINKSITMLGGVYLCLAFFGFCTGITTSQIFIPYLVILMYLMISELYLKKEHPANNWAYSMMSQLYVALPFALLNVLAFQYNEVTNMVDAYNFVLPLSIFIFIWLSDTGAYCVGSLIGKHRLFERISPKKSWEGSIGGGVLAIASSFALAHFFPISTMGNWEWAGLAFVVVVFGTWGDLTESLLKRQLGVKDSGNILPGHGGMLDRFDSALMAIPAAVTYIYILQMLR
ncbi:phosphatidate cytidylyltransferase [Bacteroides sp. 224]|uniref:phosphatidate cytidylyltransferase n=1 Tax=Bacteroides sp. 224 TaxID=2302936 RepID=UPI0013D09F4B|nr:phosphatidate cytidylyltransferase [Bacteroides sp. 224]NDV65550.1 phosphatidate cytidylyltransferase [Bacteroides sp. 224]